MYFYLIKYSKYGLAPLFLPYEESFCVSGLFQHFIKVIFYKFCKVGSGSGSALRKTSVSGSAKNNAFHSPAVLTNFLWCFTVILENFAEHFVV